MIKTYVPYEPDQQLLLPAALQEWLPDDHVAYFISDVVDQLDMSKVTARYERERRGGPPYHPRMMVKVLLYGYCVGVASSRRIAQRLHEDIAFRVLAANNTPDFRTISDFRKDNVDALSGLFVQVLALCQQAGLVKLGHVALDGTKVKANASKHTLLREPRSDESRQTAERERVGVETIDRPPGHDEAGIAVLLRRAAGDSAAWAAHPGPDDRPLPPAASGVPVRACAQTAGGGRGRGLSG